MFRAPHSGVTQPPVLSRERGGTAQRGSLLLIPAERASSSALRPQHGDVTNHYQAYVHVLGAPDQLTCTLHDPIAPPHAHRTQPPPHTPAASNCAGNVHLMALATCVLPDSAPPSSHHHTAPPHLHTTALNHHNTTHPLHPSVEATCTEWHLRHVHSVPRHSTVR